MRSFQLRGLCAALALGAFGVVASAPAVAAETSSRVIVKFKAGALAKIKTEIAKQKGQVVLDISEMNALAVKLTPKAIAALKKSKNVEFIEVDHVQHAFAPARKVTASAAVSAEAIPYGIPMVQADQVSDASAGNRTICIIDSGIDGTHPDLQGLPMTGENLTTSGAWNTDERGHGTHVAGTIAAVGGNGIGVTSVLPNKKVNLYIAKVFDSTGSTSASVVAKAMLACRKNGNANIITMSLGGSGASQFQQIVATFLDKRGILQLAAAGNGGTSAVSYPAGFAEVISVGAIDAAKNKASFSQFNSDVEIAAPGVGVLSTVPVGTGQSSTLDVGGTGYAVIAGAGSAGGSVTASLYDFGLGEVVDAGASGKVCLISRGNVSFAIKVDNCIASGGVGAVIYNNVPGPLAMDLGGAKSIVALGADGNDSASLLSKVGQSATLAVMASDYAEFNGTSMATPHASAVAALGWSRHTSCTAAQIRTSLNLAAEDLGTAGRDVNFGFGLTQAKAADDRITALGCGL